MNILEKDTHEAKLLVIEDTGETEEFARKMICRLKDPLFLPLAGPSAKAVCAEGAGYDISGLETLEKALENRTLSSEEIVSAVIRLSNAILILEAHLLGDENILLDPGRIYVKSGSLEPVFCPALFAEGSFEERLRPFLKELFLHADTKDAQTLCLASELFKVSLRKQYRMHDLMEVLEGSIGNPRESPENSRELLPAKEESGQAFPEEEYAVDPIREEMGEKAGVFQKIKDIALAAAAWVRGDDEEEENGGIRFEDHT